MYLILDCETGGVDNSYSLLTAYFHLTNDKFEKIDDLSLFLKPDDKIYRICGQALNVNKINLVEHDKIAITYKEGGTLLYNFLNTYSKDGADKLTIVGHNVGYDRECVIRNLINRGTWDKFCSYRLRDTQTIACFLIDCGIIEDISGSLESLIKYFDIPCDENQLHNAKIDTLMTMAVYKELVKMMKEGWQF